MKARRYKRRERRGNPIISDVDNTALNSIKKRLDELQMPVSPVDGLTEITGQLDRIERRMDSIEAAAVRQGAIAGSVAGGITGGLVTTAILLIKARVGL